MKDKLVEVLFDAIKKEEVHPADRRSALIRAGAIAQAYAIDTQIDAQLSDGIFGPIPTCAQG